MSAASGGVREAKDIAENSLMVATVARDWSNGREDSTLSAFSMKRLEKILQLQRRATNPLDPVASVQAQSQLAHVEVPWLTGQLQQTLTQLEELAGQK